MLTTDASSTTMNWAMHAITSTTQGLVERELTPSGPVLSIKVVLMRSLLGTNSDAKLDQTVRLSYH
jgi:hypothetical protein